MSKAPFDPATIRELATILAETGLTEIEIADKDHRVRVARMILGLASRCYCYGRAYRLARLSPSLIARFRNPDIAWDPGRFGEAALIYTARLALVGRGGACQAGPCCIWAVWHGLREAGTFCSSCPRGVLNDSTYAPVM